MVTVMSKPGPKTKAKPATEANEAVDSGDQLLRAFNELRDELVSTLWFLLGNHDDAHDVAQEAFLRCWRTQASVAGIQNVRAWIFRVGLNGVKVLQRGPSRRAVKALLGSE